jgi:hypothetical protein
MSKHDDRKQLEAMRPRLLSPGQVQAGLRGMSIPGQQLRPPQDPLQAKLFNLHRIAKKAAAGLTRKDLETMPRYPVGAFVGVKPPAMSEDDWNQGAITALDAGFEGVGS